MAITVSNAAKSLVTLVGIGSGALLTFAPNVAAAQASERFATRPYSAPPQTATPMPVSVESAPPLPTLTPEPELTPEPPTWNPASMDDVVAPPVVASGREIAAPRREVDLPRSRARPYQRGAFRRIFQDTRSTLGYDVPEALADALPWVDRDRKQEPFETVLARVADDLSRASQSDPEWARGQGREIRNLAKRLDRLSEPPPMPALTNDPAGQPTDFQVGQRDARPFRPRPIWPGASGRLEAQVRPVTVTTQSGVQEGPRALGVAARYVPSTDDEVDAPPTRIPAPRQRGQRSRTTRR
jgi:hypothetical protein